MAGLYSDLPEPGQGGAAAPAAPAAQDAEQQGASGRPGSRQRPLSSGSSRFFAMDDLSVHLVWGFLPLPCVGRAVPAACRLMLWLREEWQAWQAFAQPLRRPGRTIRIARLLRAGERGVEHLAGLAAVLEVTLAEGGEDEKNEDEEDKGEEDKDEGEEDEDEDEGQVKEQQQQQEQRQPAAPPHSGAPRLHRSGCAARLLTSPRCCAIGAS